MPSASETTTRQGEVLHPQATSPCQYQWQHAIDAWQNMGNGKCSLIGGCMFCCSACSLSGTTKTRAIHDLTSIQIADCSNCSRSTTKPVPLREITTCKQSLKNSVQSFLFTALQARPLCTRQKGYDPSCPREFEDEHQERLPQFTEASKPHRAVKKASVPAKVRKGLPRIRVTPNQFFNEMFHDKSSIFGYPHLWKLLEQ